MAVADQLITDRFAIFNGDCVEVMQNMPTGSVHLSIYSPPFGGLYHYSSDERDLSNCDDYDGFFRHYEHVVRELARVTMPGRISAVHCMDVPRSDSGMDTMIDFPGDIIRLHEREGWRFTGRRMIWKEPLAVRLRTMQKNLAHASLVADSIDCGVASGDQLLTFRRKGDNPIPVQHPQGMLDYCLRNSMWDDVRTGRLLPYREARDSEDEKHVHPLQLDVIDRCVELFSNKGETVFTPFMGVGSEVYSPLMLGRRGVGAELKASYYRQAVKNVQMGDAGRKDIEETVDLFEADMDEATL